MGDFKSLAEVRQEMEEQRQKPWRPPTNAAEVNAEMSRQRRLARETQPAQEAPQESAETAQEMATIVVKNPATESQPEELGLSYPDVKIPLNNGEHAPATAEVVAEQPVQSNGNGSKPDWNTTGYPLIAEACGITRQYAGRILNGDRNPSVATLRKMSSFFGVTMDELDSKLEAIRNAPAH